MAGTGQKALLWIGALLVVMLLFYGMDHFVMASQGLPLNLDLTPAL